MLTARLAAQRAVRVCRHNVIKAYVQQNISSPRPYNQFDQSINAHRWASSRSKPSTNPQPIDQTFKPGNDIKFSENTTPTTQPGPRAAGSDPANPVPRPDNVNAQHEAEKLAKDTSHGSNTIPFSQPGPRAANSDPGNPVPNPAPGTTAYNNSTDPDVNTNTAQQPLPDLRQGISSTFGRETGQDSASSNPDLDALLNQGGRRPREPYRPDEYETSTDRRRNRVANILYSTFAITGLIGSLYFGRPYSTSDTVPAGLDPAYVSSWSPSAIWARVKSRSKSSVGYYTEPPTLTLLPPRDPKQAPPLTLVLSLEDLLVHSGWTREHGWRTAKRPGLDYFLRYLSQYYEIVLFSTVPHHIGDPIVKKLDPVHLMQFTLFREATKFENGKHVKDLSYLNRPLETTVVIDTRAEHVANQPENAILLDKWNGDAKDPHMSDLAALVPFLENLAKSGQADLRKVLAGYKDVPVAAEFARREALLREKAKTDRFAARTVAIIDRDRAQGRAQYESWDANIRANAETWQKLEKEEQAKLEASAIKDMRSSWLQTLSLGGSK